MSELFSNVASVIREVGEVNGEIPAEVDIYADLGIESVNSIGILFALEEKFGISIDDTKFVKARTLNGLMELVAAAGN